jgi:hypothetical protein
MDKLHARSDDQLFTEMARLTTALATRTSSNWEGDRQALERVVTELERRGHEID